METKHNGEKFGKLTILSKIKGKNCYYLCQCECGKTREYQYRNLQVATTLISCKDCYKRPDRVTLVGKRFGRLIALEKIKSNKIYYRCICDCGNETVVFYSNLYSGTTKSCGCLRKDVLKARKQSDEYIRISEIGRYYRRNATTRKIKWKLIREDVKKLVTNKCYYCGFQDNINFIGIDRINNKKEYILKNCVPCCKYCNFAKNDRTQQDFKIWVKNLYNNMYKEIC